MTQQNWILKGYNSDHNKRKITINSLTKHQILRRKRKKEKRRCFCNLCKYFLFAVKFIQLLFKMARMMTLSFQILNQYFWKHILKKKVLIYVLNISTENVLCNETRMSYWIIFSKLFSFLASGILLLVGY